MRLAQWTLIELLFELRVPMVPDEVEQTLYEHAIRTKIRAPLPERLSHLGHSRVLASGIVAGAALACSLVMSSSPVTTNDTATFGQLGHPQVDTDHGQRTNFHAQPVYPQTADQASASLAMSPVGG
jgi:hypothetical protein